MMYYALHLLSIVFVVLKVTGDINWSWWLVLLPSIIASGPLVIGLVVFIIALWTASVRD